MLSKPVEKIMIRYDMMPDDILGFSFFPSIAVSPVLISASRARDIRPGTLTLSL